MSGGNAIIAAGGWHLQGGEDLLEAMTQEHPLQPFSTRYFHEGDPNLFSYAREWQQLHEPQTALAQPETLAAHEQEEPLSLTQLQDFLRNPVRHFFSQRLKVFFEAAEVPLEDEEPFVLDALQRYTLSDSLLEAALAQPDQLEHALQTRAQRLQGSGLLPMAGFGECLRHELIEPLPDILQRYQQLLALWPTPLNSALPVSVEGHGLTLEGWLSNLHQRSDKGLLSITTIPNSIGAIKTRKWHRLTKPWVNHLVACASGLNMSTALVASDETLLLAPLPPQLASDILGNLLMAWKVGMNHPLPIAIKTGFAWLAQTDPVKADAAAQKAYEGDGQTSEGERRESAALARQFPDYAALMADGAFEDWCDALYRPLFDASWRSLNSEESR